MSDAFVGEVRLFAGNFAPVGWQLCNGQLVSINENQALFALLGTTYGGDGRSTFGLPDMRGRVVVGVGSGAGLTPRQAGQMFGTQSSTIQQGNMPAHSHGFFAAKAAATDTAPGNAVRTFGIFPAQSSTKGLYSVGGASTAATLNNDILSTVPGNATPHSNMMSTLTLNYIISMQGIFPSPA